MKLACNKCKKVLTTDLYYVKITWKEGLFGNDLIKNTGDVFYKGENGRMKSGLFFISKSHFPKQKIGIVVGEGSLLQGVIPPFIQGYGCCNYSMGEPLLCSCGNRLGGMSLDCYESGSVKFNMDSVDRVYK